MKLTKIYFFTLIIFTVVCSTNLFAENKVQTFARLFSYDPHPNSAIFAKTIPYSGSLAQAEVVFHEVWTTKSSKTGLTKVGFTLNLKSNNKILGTINIKPVTISSNMQKAGSIVAVGNINNVKLQVSTISTQKDKSSITDMTLKFELTYDNSTMTSVQKTQRPTGSSNFTLSLAEKFEKRADELKEGSNAEKIVMYKRALKIAPANNSSAMATAFHTRVTNKITALSGGTTAVQTSTTETIETPSADEEASIYQNTTSKTQLSSLLSSANQQVSNKQYTEALSTLKQAVQLFPNNTDALKQLGMTALQNQNLSLSQDAFSKLMNLGKLDKDSLQAYFKSLFLQGKGSEGLDMIKEVVSKYPSNGDLKLVLANALLQNGNISEAGDLIQNLMKNKSTQDAAKKLMSKLFSFMN